MKTVGWCPCLRPGRVRVPPDPFVVVADGRSAFRVQDLVELAALLRQLDEENSDGPGEGVSS